MSYNNKEDVTILPNIGSFVTVEHYKRHGSLSNNGSHQILVSAFIQLWLLKLGKTHSPTICGPNISTIRHSSFSINQIELANSAVLILPTMHARSHLSMQLPRSLLSNTPKQRRAIPHPQQPQQSHPRHHWPSMFRLLLVFVAILVILGRLCMTGSFMLRPCRHQGKSASVPAFNCFEVSAFGEPLDCRILGFSGALALAAASARIADSMVATCAWQDHLR